MVGGLGIHHDGLAAVQHDIAAGSLGGGLDAREVIAGNRFAMGERELHVTLNELFDQRLLVVVAQRGDQPAAQDGGVEQRFHDAGAAQFLEHGREVEAEAAKAALIFGEQGADDAEFGQFGPDFGRITLVRVDDGVAGLGVVFVRQIATQGVLQHLAFFGQVEIHLLSLPSSLWR